MTALIVAIWNVYLWTIPDSIQNELKFVNDSGHVRDRRWQPDARPPLTQKVERTWTAQVELFIYRDIKSWSSSNRPPPTSIIHAHMEHDCECIIYKFENKFVDVDIGWCWCVYTHIQSGALKHSIVTKNERFDCTARTQIPMILMHIQQIKPNMSFIKVILRKWKTRSTGTLFLIRSAYLDELVLYQLLLGVPTK